MIERLARRDVTSPANLKLIQMKRQRGRRLPQAFADFARRQPVGALLDQQAEDIEAGFLGQRAERRDHGSTSS